MEPGRKEDERAEKYSDSGKGRKIIKIGESDCIEKCQLKTPKSPSSISCSAVSELQPFFMFSLKFMEAGRAVNISWNFVTLSMKSL